MDLKSKRILKYISYTLLLLLFSVNLYAQKVEIGKTFKGKASFYHKKFSGRKTASGERLNNNDFTCAHKYYPFGTMIEVENPVTKKWVIVRVNDRGPFSKGRVLDLSYEAAKMIGMISKGIMSINAKVVGKDGEILLYREGSTEDNFQEIFPKDTVQFVVPYLPETSASKKKN
jgi:rare lipoprotein A